VLTPDIKAWEKLIDYFRERGNPVFIFASQINPEQVEVLARQTPVALLRYGFLRVGL